MPRALKSYVTSVGFFDLAVTAPSMKAALEAWGAAPHLFQQGFAKETHDPAIVKATMAAPGVVLKRAVGSSGAFTQDAALPKSLPVEKLKERPIKPAAKKPDAKPPRAPDAKLDKAKAAAARKAQADFAKAQMRREAERAREDAERERQTARRAKAVAQAEAALEKADTANQAALDEIARQRTALDKRMQSEEARWEKERDRLRDAIARARNS